MVAVFLGLKLCTIYNTRPLRIQAVICRFLVSGFPNIVQISVPCIKPYFHKDTLTPPYSSRSPPLAGGGPSTYATHDASLIMHAIYFEIYAPPLEGIQLKSIAGYETFVCVCFYAYKTLCAALHMASRGRL